MAFALNGTNLPSIRCYADALRIWDNATPWRGQTGERDYRPLGRWRKDYLRIHKGYEDEYRMRYHSTDCVIYWPDGSVTIEGYSSRSTNTFVRELAPEGFKPDFIKAEMVLWVPMLWEECRAVTSTGLKMPYSRELRFKPVRDRPTYPLYWELHEDSDKPEPFTQRVMDKKQTKLALKDTNYCDFVPWANAVRHMLKRPEVKRKPYQPGDYKYNADQLVELLGQGMKGWMKILNDRGSNCAAHVRDAIYQTTTRPIVIERDVPCIQGYADYESFVGNTKKLDKC